MADPTTARDSIAGHDRQAPPGAPRWVKIAAAIALIAVVMIAVMLLFGADHGPGRQTSGGAGADPAVSATRSAIGGGHSLASGAHRP